MPAPNRAAAPIIAPTHAKMPTPLLEPSMALRNAIGPKRNARPPRATSILPVPSPAAVKSAGKIR
jgi:hypothetical protein